jgi:hypothetical protein
VEAAGLGRLTVLRSNGSMVQITTRRSRSARLRRRVSLKIAI